MLYESSVNFGLETEFGLQSQTALHPWLFSVFILYFQQSLSQWDEAPFISWDLIYCQTSNMKRTLAGNINTWL